MVSTEKPMKKELVPSKRVESLEFDDGLEIDQEEMRDLDEGNRATSIPNDKKAL
jgi:hypothetical protein